MAVGETQLFNNFMKYMMAGTLPLWTASQWYASLWSQAGVDPADTCDDMTALDVTHNELAVAGDYDRKALGTLAIIGTAPQCGYDSAVASWGNPVSITAKYLILANGDITLAGTDKLVLWVDLDTTTTAAEVQSVAGTFSVDASTDGWFYIAGQPAP